jgi:hypothetical protein
LLVSVIVSSVLITAVLFRICLSPPEEDRVHGAPVWGGLGFLLLLPSLVVGLMPGWTLAHIAGPEWADWGSQVYSSITPGVWITVLLPVGVGIALSMWPPAVSAVSLATWQWVAGVWSLAWACSAVEAVACWSTGVLDTVTEVLHGEHYLLWAFLVVLLIAWLYLLP